MNSLLLVVVCLVAVAAGQPVLQFGFQPQPDYSHRAVLVNAQMESQLPDALKNPFYRNPRIAQALAKESWFGPGESPVAVREAEKIPRERIFSVLKNAGLARR